MEAQLRIVSPVPEPPRASGSSEDGTLPSGRGAPHLHLIVLDGVDRERGASTVGFTALPRLSTREVGEVLETICRRVVKLLRRRKLFVDGVFDPEAEEGVASLAASAVSGQSPPAGPEWRPPSWTPTCSSARSAKGG